MSSGGTIAGDGLTKEDILYLAGLVEKAKKEGLKMDIFYTAIKRVVRAVLEFDRVYKATVFLDRRHVVRATRRRFGGKILKRGPVEISLTIGRPNYAECRWQKKNPAKDFWPRAIRPKKRK